MRLSLSHPKALQLFLTFFFYWSFKNRLLFSSRSKISCNLISFPDLHNQICWQKHHSHFGECNREWLFSGCWGAHNTHWTQQMIKQPWLSHPICSHSGIDKTVITLWGHWFVVVWSRYEKAIFSVEAVNVNSLHVPCIKGISAHQELITFHFPLFFFPSWSTHASTAEVCDNQSLLHAWINLILLLHQCSVLKSPLTYLAWLFKALL